MERRRATATAPPPSPCRRSSTASSPGAPTIPELLRHLGLAIDVLIRDDPAIHEYTVDPRRRRFERPACWSPLLADDAARPSRTPTTPTGSGRRRSRVELPDVVDGSLVLDRTDGFLIEQLDPDGSALKVTTLLADLERTDAGLRESASRNNHAPSMTPDASSLPALKSAGLIIARRDRAEGLVHQFDASADHENERTAGRPPRELNAADVTRGWRVDIRDEASGSPEWFSLHRRSGEYELVAPDRDRVPLDVQPGPDEGYLKAASTSSNEVEPTADQYFHETLAGWDGWSLAVKRPGKIVDETRPVDPQAEPPDVADTGFPLAARFSVQPGSLPRLRYGRRYAVRVRAVDLSGRSIPDDQLDETHERELDQTYQRWEPVPSPAVVPLTEYTEGESLMRMVIRSTLDVPVADYVELDRVQSLPGHEASGDLGIVYRDENERNLAAPIGSVQLAETHGMLDAALAGDPAAVAAQFALASRESGSYLTLPGGRVVSKLAVPSQLDGTKEQVLPDGEYVVHPNRTLSLPYLPDPLARGISFTTLPGDTGGGGGAGGEVVGTPPTRLLRWPGAPGAWYDRRPVLVRIVEGDAAPSFDAPTRTLTVSLPKATLATVRLSSFLDDADVDLMRVWHLIDEHQAPASADQRDTVRRGRHWMITPFTELTLVHAVEMPLEPPEIRLGPGKRRDVAATFSLLPGTVHNHAASTGRIDLDADWEDPVDDVLEPAPRSEPKRAHVADFELLVDETDALMWPTSGSAAGPFGPRHEVRHEFGDTRHRYVDYTAKATTRFREYFPPKITDDPELITSVGPKLRVDVPSSARPAPPDLKYIVPTWEWRTEPIDVESPLAVRRVRTAGGLRVYLGRPWFSSGPDELLGVVLARQPWITWPLDVERGVLGDSVSQALADGWAREVLEASGVAVSSTKPAAEQLAAHVSTTAARVRREAAGSTGARVRARDDLERFLVATDRAVEASRGIDPELVAAVETGAAAGILTEFLPLFSATGPEGRRFTSVWGVDPVFAGEPLPNGPFAHQFPLRTAVGTVRLAELDDQVTVVGHQPEFDPERRLWYCDIQVETGDAYTPFVQLALARYQPHSVSGQEISPVVARRLRADHAATRRHLRGHPRRPRRGAHAGGPGRRSRPRASPALDRLRGARVAAGRGVGRAPAARCVERPRLGGGRRTGRARRAARARGRPQPSLRRGRVGRRGGAARARRGRAGAGAHRRVRAARGRRHRDPAGAADRAAARAAPRVQRLGRPALSVHEVRVSEPASAGERSAGNRGESAAPRRSVSAAPTRLDR